MAPPAVPSAVSSSSEPAPPPALLLQQLLGGADQQDHQDHPPPPPPFSAVSVSVLLLPASPDFLRFQGRLRIEPAGPAAHGAEALALPLALRCAAPGGPVLLESLRGDGAFQRLWAAVVSKGHVDRLGQPGCCGDVGSFAAELAAVLEEALGRRLSQRQAQAQARQGASGKGKGKGSGVPNAHRIAMRPGAYLRLLRELEALGWEHIEALDAASATAAPAPASSSPSPSITLRHSDARGCAHSLRLTLAADHPYAAPVAVAARLPGGAAFEPQPTAPDDSEKTRHQRAGKRPRREQQAGAAAGVAGGGGERKTWGLAGVLRQFAARVAEFQPFWEVMDDIDAHCWCLGDGQERRDRATVSRRLVLPAPHASLVVKIDPTDPRRVCDAHFIGPESVTRPLQDKIYRNLAHWDARRLPRENLEALLEVQLPPPPKNEPLPSSSSSSAHVKQEPGAGGGGGGGVVAGQDVRGECAVCYAYRLDTTAAGSSSSSSSGGGQDDDAGSTPTVACDNPQCGRIYHPRCLRGWLATLPGTQTLGGGGGGAAGRLMGGGGGGGGGAGVTLLGSCPYCTQAIALDVPAAGGGGSEME